MISQWDLSKDFRKAVFDHDIELCLRLIKMGFKPTVSESSDLLYRLVYLTTHLDGLDRERNQNYIYQLKDLGYSDIRINRYSNRELIVQAELLGLEVVVTT